MQTTVQDSKIKRSNDPLRAALNYRAADRSPQNGPRVVAAYKAGEIYSMEKALWVIAHLLDQLED